MLTFANSHLKTGARVLIAVFALATLLALSGQAMPPHPDLEQKIIEGRAAMPSFLTNAEDKHERGICTGNSDVMRRFLKQQQALHGRDANGASLAPTNAPFRVLAVMVDFSDQVAQTPAVSFDSLLFGMTGSTVRSFYDEVSYSQIDLVTANMPSALGWQRAANPYSYYVGPTGSGTGTYPANSQGLVREIAQAIDSLVDYSLYDNDNDGYVDVFVLMHSGTGAEYSGDTLSDIWSHKWSLPWANRYLSGEGTYVYDYTVQPEFWSNPGDMTIGVVAHELGHGFGLPDLYDVDYTSRGIGRWGLMAGGSWNGSLGSSPAHPCAWSRIQMGITTPINVTSNTTGASIGAVENGGSIYRLWSSGAAGNEYFLIENRQRTGYDTGLPSQGLLIWHVDESAPSWYGSNMYEWYPGQDSTQHYVVALEQADGNFSLEQNGSSGDSGDPFPGSSNNTTFNAVSAPNSHGYISGTSFVAVDNISSSAMTMTADLIVGLAADIDLDDDELLPTSVELAQNYPNPFNPTTVINFSVNVASDVSLDIFNVLGQKVRTLYDGSVAAGDYSVVWDGTDRTGARVSSGIYFYRLAAGDREEIRKMVLVR